MANKNTEIKNKVNTPHTYHDVIKKAIKIQRKPYTYHDAIKKTMRKNY
ncbi:MAG: hypothetical protein ACXAD7_15200 [Candidatus Kariarchaeaceae archaeon]